jgi:putative ABC transport system permease protein
MIQTLYLAWHYLSFHRLKTAILVTSITLITYLPTGLRVLVQQSSDQLTARAESTPLIVGARGSPLELVLNTLYFRSEYPEPLGFVEVEKIRKTGLAEAIPMYVRFHSRGTPIVGTSFDYFEFRGLDVAEGRHLATLGACVAGSRVAEALGIKPGDHVISSPENVFDLAGVYPLKMRVVGVLDFSDSADDDAIFVDLKTAWVIEGLGHGHQDMAKPDAVSGVLAVEGNKVVANASVVQYSEITEDNIDSFHFHGDLSEYPITAVLAVPPDTKSSALLQGRFETADLVVQIVRPTGVMNDLLDTVLTVQQFVVAGAIIVGAATLASVALVFMLSLRLRRREIETIFKIGGSRISVGLLMTSEIIGVLVLGVLCAGGLTLITREFGAVLIRAVLRM